jgi:hypothetical protein
MNRSELMKEATSLDFKKPNRLLTFDSLDKNKPIKEEKEKEKEKEDPKSHGRITDIIKAANKDRKNAKKIYEVNKFWKQ